MLLFLFLVLGLVILILVLIVVVVIVVVVVVVIIVVLTVQSRPVRCPPSCDAGIEQNGLFPRCMQPCIVISFTFRGCEPHSGDN